MMTRVVDRPVSVARSPCTVWSIGQSSGHRVLHPTADAPSSEGCRALIELTAGDPHEHRVLHPTAGDPAAKGAGPWVHGGVTAAISRADSGNEATMRLHMLRHRVFV